MESSSCKGTIFYFVNIFIIQTYKQGRAQGGLVARATALLTSSAEVPLSPPLPNPPEDSLSKSIIKSIYEEKY